MTGFGRGMVLLLLGAACTPMKPAQAPEGTASAESRLGTAANSEESPFLAVRDVQVEPVGDGRRVTLALTRAADGVSDFTTGTPPRLVLDLAGPRQEGAVPVARYPFTDPLVSQVRIGTHEGTLRAVVDLSDDPGTHIVRREGATVIVDFGDTGAAANAVEPPAPTTLTAAESPIPAAATETAAVTPPTREPSPVEAQFLAVEDVRVEPAGEGRRLVVSLSRTPDGVTDFTLPSPPRLVMDVRGPAAIAATRPTRHPVTDDVVTGVRIAANGKGTLRVVADLSTSPGTHAVRIDGTRLVADLGETGGIATSRTDTEEQARVARAVFTENEPEMEPVPAIAHVALPEATPVIADGGAPSPRRAVTPVADTVPAAAPPPMPEPVQLAAADPPAPKPAAAPAPPPADRVEVARTRRPAPEPAPSTRAFTGQQISLDFKDADIQNVLRVLADVSHLNIIATDDVKGKVTLHLSDVPWDQALDLVLRSNRLEMMREGNVARISTLTRLKEEREALRAAEDAERELEPLRVRYIKVNYARADESLVDKVKGVLTDRGSVTFDDRTNTVIVRDIPRGLEDATQLIRELDVQSPQVLIEANIVEATEDFARALGVQWGYQFNAGPATGNPTGMNFPGTVDLSGSGLGRAAPTLGPTGGTVRPGVPFLADFPVPSGFGGGFGPGSGSALDLALGSIDGTQSLAIRLTALEEEGKGKVISRPRVITMNNVAATIQSLTILRVKLPSTGTVINTGTGGAAGTASTATEKINTGITLVVTPQVSSDGFVLMSIYAKSSQPDFTRSVEGIPSEISREANSNVLIRDAETVVLGGIFRQTEDDREAGLPYLRSIPGLGWLFKRKLHNNHREELLVFLTPKILNPGNGQQPMSDQLWEDRRPGG